MEDRFYTTEDNQLVDNISGEVIKFSDIKKAKEKKLVNAYNEMCEDLISIGSVSEFVLVRYKNRDYNCRTIKKDYTFNKEFRVELRDIMSSKILSKNARCFIGTLTPFIAFPSNAIHINYQNPTTEGIMDILDMGKNVIYSTMKELEEKDIIKRIKNNGDTVIYFNPFLFCGGYCVESHVYDLFITSCYNPEHKTITIKK